MSVKVLNLLGLSQIRAVSSEAKAVEGITVSNKQETLFFFINLIKKQQDDEG